MKKCDILWLVLLLAATGILIIDSTRAVFVYLTKTYPYVMGFVKVAVLATMGELLALRIVTGDWHRPIGLWMRVVVWGFLGMTFVAVFDVFAGGTLAAAQKGLLPVAEKGFYRTLGLAFWTSTLMNLIFAPTFMTLHRITDTYIELAEGKLRGLSRICLGDVIAKINWQNMIGFVMVKTIPFFWIPAHTVTFLLPPEFRILMAAFLSIALGAILAFAKRKSQTA